MDHYRDRQHQVTICCTILTPQEFDTIHPFGDKSLTKLVRFRSSDSLSVRLDKAYGSRASHESYIFVPGYRCISANCNRLATASPNNYIPGSDAIFAIKLAACGGGEILIPLVKFWCGFTVLVRF